MFCLCIKKRGVMIVFCPNCGKNCGTDRFCSACGTALVREAKQEKDLHDTFLTDIPNDKVLVGVFGNGFAMGTIELGEDSFSILVRSVLRKHKVSIPYNQVTAARYIRATVSKAGYLCIRYEANKDVPIPMDKQISIDKYTVPFNGLNDMVFYHIFCYLRASSPSPECFSMDDRVSLTDKEERVNQHIDLQHYFQRFNPYRSEAAWAMCQEAGIDLRIAKKLVTQAFDVFQKERYEADPKAALVDLNLIVRAQTLNGGWDRIR